MISWKMRRFTTKNHIYCESQAIIVRDYLDKLSYLTVYVKFDILWIVWSNMRKCSFLTLMKGIDLVDWLNHLQFQIEKLEPSS